TFMLSRLLSTVSSLFPYTTLCRSGEVRGAVTVASLLEQLATGAITADTTLADLELEALPMVGVMTPVADVKTVLAHAPAALVTRDGNIAGIVSTHDILMHLIEN